MSNEQEHKDVEQNEEEIVETPTLSPEERYTGMTSEELSEYVPFAVAAKSIGVRFQQVYQRAVIRNKMRWVDTGKRKVVHKEDVETWKAIRVEYFAKSSK